MVDSGHLCTLTSCWPTPPLEDTTAGGIPSRDHGSFRYTTVKIVFFFIQYRIGGTCGFNDTEQIHIV